MSETNELLKEYSTLKADKEEYASIGDIEMMSSTQHKINVLERRIAEKTFT